MLVGQCTALLLLPPLHLLSGSAAAAAVHVRPLLEMAP
jgi:hypothetical protein